MKKYTLLLLIVITALASCKKSGDNVFPSPLPLDSPLFGSWVAQEYEGDILVMRRAELIEDVYGFTFYNDGWFVERKNSSSCNTPPFVFEDYEGKWTFQPNEMYRIKVGYWGGQTSFDIEVVYIDNETLKFLYHYDLP